MSPARACWKCDNWPGLAFTFEGRDWCGPCAPWARQPWPYGHLDELARRVLARLDAPERRRARLDAEKVVTWLERAKARWPGPDPWKTVRLASKAQARLLVLEVWRPSPPHKTTRSGGRKWLGATDARRAFPPAAVGTPALPTRRHSLKGHDSRNALPARVRRRRLRRSAVRAAEVVMNDFDGEPAPLGLGPYDGDVGPGRAARRLATAARARAQGQQPLRLPTQ